MEADFLFSLENEETVSSTTFDLNAKFYLVGGGISALAVATYLIKIAEVRGENILILDEKENLKDSQSINHNHLVHGHSWLDDTCSCTFDLLSNIPSNKKGNSNLLDEFLNFKKEHPIHSRARMFKDQKIVDNPEMELNQKDRWDLINLILRSSEKSLEGQSIDNLFQDSFFDSNFWKLWSSSFGFKPEHSAIELKRYLNRFLHEIPYLSSLSGMNSIPYNLSDSLVLPLKTWLSNQGVIFESNSQVIKLEMREYNNSKKIVHKIHYVQNNQPRTINLENIDYVFTTIGSIGEKMSVGSMQNPPNKNHSMESWKLWQNLSSELPDFGNPHNFLIQSKDAACCYFTINCNSSVFFDLLERVTLCSPGENGLITFANSNWEMSFAVPAQPFFKNQNKDELICWGYGINMNKRGNFVNKIMSDCSGTEILEELIGHLGLREHSLAILKSADCIPCYLPLGGSALLPRYKNDRPALIPDSCQNLACIGQFCEQSTEPTSTIEYSIRSAQRAVIELLGLYHDTPHIYHGSLHLSALYKAGKTLFKKPSLSKGEKHV